MNYSYLLPSLVYAGVLVIGVDARQAKAGSSSNGLPDPVLRRIPPHLAKLKLAAEQQELIRLLLDRADSERRRAGKDRLKLQAARERFNRMVDEILTKQQRALLRSIRIGKRRDGRS